MSDLKDAIRMYFSGDLFEAEKILNEILLEEPDNINALARLADVQADLDRYEAAGDAYLKVAGLYEKEGNYEDCMSFMEKASQFIPHFKITHRKGRCLYHLGRYTDALSNFVVSSPDKQNLFYTGKTYYALRQYNNAIRVFREVTNTPANTEELFRVSYWVGKSLYALGEVDQAIKIFKSYISVYPKEKQTYLDLATAFLDSGHLEDAKKNLLQYQKMGGTKEIVSLYLGIVNYRMGKYRDAISLLDETPLGEQALHWKGLSLYEIGRYEDALQCFSLASKQETRPLYYKMIGNCYLKQGSFYEAKIYYEKALDVDPADEDLKNLISVSENLLKSEEPD